MSGQHVRKIRLILAQLNIATEPTAMNIPGMRFYALTGDRKGQYAVSVSGNWRIVFAFEGQDATDVDLVDYR